MIPDEDVERVREAADIVIETSHRSPVSVARAARIETLLAGLREPIAPPADPDATPDDADG